MGLGLSISGDGLNVNLYGCCWQLRCARNGMIFCFVLLICLRRDCFRPIGGHATFFEEKLLTGMLLFGQVFSRRVIQINNDNRCQVACECLIRQLSEGTCLCCLCGRRNLVGAGRLVTPVAGSFAERGDVGVRSCRHDAIPSRPLCCSFCLHTAAIYSALAV